MILRMFALYLEPEDPLRFSLDNLRSDLNGKMTGYFSDYTGDTAGFIHRYPVLQCKQVRNDLIVTGIGQGADFLCRYSRDQDFLGDGGSRCRITARDPEVRPELFGITDSECTYEFLTPWLALNQQHAKKFYDLKGKPERDSFMQKLLTSHLQMFAKSLDLRTTDLITCEAKVKFRHERIDRENVIIFLGKFRTRLRIPDYLGIGRSVSLGYGTIKRITDCPETCTGEP